MPDLSIVVVTTKNRDEILCISTFEDSDFNDYEFIVRDDKGIATARNEGVKKASADKIVFIDDDAEPEAGYLQAASAVLEEKPVVAGKVTHPGNGTISRLAGHYPTEEEPRYIDYVVGCNMGFRKEVFEKVGYFDENFLWGHEEMEFVERVKREYPVYYEPGMAVIHPYADGIIDYWRKQYRFGPADIYQAKKNGKTTRDLFFELLNPTWYFNSDPRTVPVYTIGKFCRAMSRIANLQKSANSSNKWVTNNFDSKNYK